MRARELLLRSVLQLIRTPHGHRRHSEQKASWSVHLRYTSQILEFANSRPVGMNMVSLFLHGKRIPGAALSSRPNMRSLVLLRSVL